MRYWILLGLLCASVAQADNHKNGAEILDALRAQYLAAGSTESILFWSNEQRRVGFREITNIASTREVHKGDKTYTLKEQPVDLSGVTYEVNGETRTVQDFIDRDDTIGLIVVHKDNIIFESYQEGNDKSSRWVSFSVTKSVTSMLIGAAIKDGYIESVFEPVVNYLPRLRGTAYEKTTIRDVLQMSSGVAWNEDYANPNSDVANAGALNGLPLVRYLANLEVDEILGQKFNYSTGETNLVGQILRAAIGNNAATYLTDKIWQPFGMEFDASWTLDGENGAELGGCCINATLRDYARLGIFAMKNGVLSDGTKVLPDDWMKDSTSPSQGYKGYGYLWWLYDNGHYAARGIFGQTIYIEEDEELVIATHNNAPAAVGTSLHEELNLVLMAISDHIGSR